MQCNKGLRVEPGTSIPSGHSEVGGKQEVIPIQGEAGRRNEPMPAYKHRKEI